MAEKNDTQNSGSTTSKKLITVFSLFTLIMLIGSGAAGYYFLIHKPAQEAAKKERNAVPVPELDQSTAIGPMVDIEEFIINIISDDSNRYVKASFTIELTNENVQEEVIQRMPQIRDSILLLVGNKTYEELQDLQGKKQLKAELTSKVNSILISGRVKAIYFTDFVVQ